MTLRPAQRQALPQQADVVVLGAGLSGLAFVSALTQAMACSPMAPRLKLWVIEPRHSYARDRTFSYWACDGAPLGHGAAGIVWPAPRAQWASWRVASGGQTGPSLPCYCAESMSYASVDADAVYDHFLSGPAATAANWQGGSAAWHAQGAALCVTTSNGEQILPALVVDARGAAPVQSGEWAQHFVGLEVQAAQPVFNAESMDLMHFEPLPEGLKFLYVLPYSAHSALIEETFVSRWPGAAGMDAAQAEARIGQYIQARWRLEPQHWRIVFRERGALPLRMEPKPAPTHPCVLRLGTAASSMRPSTGYAYADTVAHAHQAAAAVLSLPWSQRAGVMDGSAWQSACAQLPRWQHSTLDVKMDSLFMRVLESDFCAAPDLFCRLFARCEPAALLRFLVGQASVADRSKVIASLPKWPFIQTLLAKTA